MTNETEEHINILRDTLNLYFFSILIKYLQLLVMGDIFIYFILVHVLIALMDVKCIE